MARSLWAGRVAGEPRGVKPVARASGMCYRSRTYKEADMQKRWVDGEEFWLHRGRWVPRRHFYDHGEEPIYLGPRRRNAVESALFGFASCCIEGGYVIGKLLGH